jgi:NADP-dependent 3-hydroxy acid dehydrogenase YdfG
MKIIITGHTEGIGKAFYDFYTVKGYEVVGYSRSNGYDISNHDNICKVVSEVMKGCDVFINNAYSSESQVTLMRMIDKLWKSELTKTHVVLGSRASDIPTPNENYVRHKKRIDQVAIELQKNAAYRLLVLKPGRVDTPGLARIRKGREPKPMIDVNELVYLTDYLISIKTMNVMSITLEPAL